MPHTRRASASGRPEYVTARLAFAGHEGHGPTGRPAKPAGRGTFAGAAHRPSGVPGRWTPSHGLCPSPVAWVLRSPCPEGTGNGPTPESAIQRMASPRPPVTLRVRTRRTLTNRNLLMRALEPLLASGRGSTYGVFCALALGREGDHPRLLVHSVQAHCRIRMKTPQCRNV